MRTIRWCLAVLLVVPAAPADEPRPGVDRFGDPLPPGAVARLGTDRLRHAGMGGEDDSFAFRPDGKAVATWNESTVRLWDLADGRRLWEFDSRSTVLAVTFSPDGKRLAACTGSGVRLVDGATGRAGPILIRAIRTAVALSPDGHSLAVSEPAWGGPVEVWDLATGQRTSEFSIPGAKPDPDPKPAALAFSDDGKVLRAAAIGTHGGSAFVRVASWDLATGERRPDFDPGPRMHAFALSDTGRLIGTRSAADSTIHVWDTAAGKLVAKVEVGHGMFNFGPGGKTLVTETYDRPERATQVSMWDAATGKRLHDFTIPRELGEAARLSPDGKTVATPKRGEMLCLWDAATGRPRLAAGGHNGQVTGLAFADGGAVLVSTDRGGEVRTWDAATGAHRA
ncbi:MAG: hypothetical protein J2P46_09625, partial [Zavarzinella sp.]|nr:hypothetical protein [Zavarzinella sp.]